jgi:hypothetical protein
MLEKTKHYMYMIIVLSILEMFLFMKTEQIINPFGIINIVIAIIVIRGLKEC